MKDIRTIFENQFLADWDKDYPPTEGDFELWLKEIEEAKAREERLLKQAQEQQPDFSGEDWENTKWHTTPSGGDHSTAYYYNKEGLRCQRKDAYEVHIVEYKGDERINETYGFVPNGIED